MPPSLLFVGSYLAAGANTPAASTELGARLAREGYPVRFTSGLRSQPMRLADMLGTVMLRRGEYEIGHVDVYSGRAFLYAEAVTYALRVLNKPVVLTLHGGALPLFARRWPRRVHRLLAAATAVTTPSRYLLDELRLFRSDLRLIPNPLDVSAYPFRAREPAAPRLVWLRAFHQIYDPALAPAVVAALAEQFPDVSLTMIGPDKGDGALAATVAAAERLGVRDRVAIVGSVAKHAVPERLASADIFLNTATVDNAPVSVLEAMATGLCVVSSRVGGVPYLVSDGETGLLVPPGDAGAMAAAVTRLLTEPGLSGRLSRAGRASAELQDWAQVLPAWRELLAAIDRRELAR